MCTSYGTVLVVMFIFLLLPSLVVSHGLLWNPPQRGATNGNAYSPVAKFDPSATVDYAAHFPAGSKSLTPGAGLKSQIKAAGSKGWTPYEPMNIGFQFRAGVCGDRVRGREHLRGGKFYNKDKAFKTYHQGDVISLDVAVTTHHNGFFEFFVCDVAKCGGEIGPECFRRGYCHRLERAWDASCESRDDKACAPIDPNYPSRWYLPCPSGKVDLYGAGKMLYKLPERLNCTHCVLQWYWATANSCNPPGLAEFYKSDRAPEWGQCKGQGDAVGGWRRWKTQCGDQIFSEEYYECADIQILPKRNKPRMPKNIPDSKAFDREGQLSKRWRPNPKIKKVEAKKLKASKLRPKHQSKQQLKLRPKPVHPVWWGKNRGSLMKIVLLADGKPISDMYHGSTLVIDVKRYKHITFRVATFRKIRDGVGFYLNGRRWWIERKMPYIFGGDAGVWHQPWYNEEFRLAVVGEGNRLVIKLTLKK